MTLLLTESRLLFIIAAMEPNLSNILVPMENIISSQKDDQDLSVTPIGDKFQQMLVSFLLVTSVFNIGTNQTGSENGEYSPSDWNGFFLGPQIPPVNGILTQGFHSGHFGIDTAIPVGTPVKATMDGTVIHAGWNSKGYGNLVIIHNGEFKVYFAHLSEIPVMVGDKVRTGWTIGLSGSTGNSTGPHLHYEVRIHDDPVNPVHFNG